MSGISAAAVKALRDRTQLPMLECKKALEEAEGDENKAIELLRKRGAKTMESRLGRATSFGRYGLYASPTVGALVEVRCESDPVAGSPVFVQLASDLACRLATGPGAADAEALLAQPSPSDPSQKLQQQFDDLTNKIREVFRIERMVRFDGPCAGYVHHTGTTGVLLEVEGSNAEAAKDICMHIAAMRPASVSKDDLDPSVIEKEREILTEAARAEGKPEAIIGKMVEGRLKNFYAERCLLEQPFVKDQAKSVGEMAQEAGLKVGRFVLWEIGRATE